MNNAFLLLHHFTRILAAIIIACKRREKERRAKSRESAECDEHINNSEMNMNRYTHTERSHSGARNASERHLPHPLNSMACAFLRFPFEAINFHYHIRLPRLGSECDRIHREGGWRRPPSGRRSDRVPLPELRAGGRLNRLDLRFITR